jgi:hypothetical protein
MILSKGICLMGVTMRIRNTIVLTGAALASFMLPSLADLTDNPSDFNSPSAGTDLRGPVQTGETVPFTNVNNPPPVYQQPKLDNAYTNGGASTASPANNPSAPAPQYSAPDAEHPLPKKKGGGGGVTGATLGVPDRAAKSSVGLTDRAAKSSVGLTDRAAKSSVGLADRAAKTSVGVPVKIMKSLF